MSPDQHKRKKSKSSEIPNITAIEEDVLTVLLGRELYGLQIVDQINLDRPGKRLSFSSLYPALNRLEKKGLVTWQWGDEVKSAGARRKYFKVSGLGSRVLSAVQQYRAALATRSIQAQSV